MSGQDAETIYVLVTYLGMKFCYLAQHKKLLESLCLEDFGFCLKKLRFFLFEAVSGPS